MKNWFHGVLLFVLAWSSSSLGHIWAKDWSGNWLYGSVGFALSVAFFATLDWYERRNRTDAIRNPSKP